MKFLLMVVFSFSINSAIAAGEKVIKLSVKDQAGDEIKISLVPYKNHLESLEVRIEANALPRLNKNFNPLLGFARDTDDNGKVDAWFFITKNGMDLTLKEGSDPLGKDIIGSLLHQKYRSSLGMYAATATTSLLSYFFMAANEGLDVEKQFFNDYMDLEENRLAFEKDIELMRTSMTRQQMQFHYEVTSLGFKEMANRMDSFAKRGFWGYALADIGLWITGSYVLKWVGKILYKTGIVASEMAFINTLKETFIGFFEKQKSNLVSKIAVLEEKIALKNTAALKSKNAAAAKTALVLSAQTWKTALASSLKTKKAKGRIINTLTSSSKWTFNAAKAAAKEWKYIVLGTSIQLGSEAYARYDEIKDANPAITAKNLFTNPEVQQNVAYMTTETIMMTGISKSLKSTKAKFMASGAVALTNSSILNLVIKDDPDMKRMAIDTGWEVFIGNAQIQLDLASMEFFEKMSLKKNNPKLKLLGYGVVLVNTAVGYVVYSKVTSSAAEPKTEEKSQIMLVPILAETN